MLDHGRQPLIAVLVVGLLLVAAPPPLWAQSTGENESSAAPTSDNVGTDQPVPILDNFTVGELALTGTFVVGAAFMGYLGDTVFGIPDPSMGPPSPGSTDWEVAVELNPHPDLKDPFLWNVPNLIGDPILVSAAGAYYGFGAVGTWLTDAEWIWDTRHEFLAFAEAIAWSEFIVQTSKFIFGRARPREVRACNPPDDPCGPYDIPPSRNVEPNGQEGLSFPGGHTAASSAAMSFIYLDLSDHLVFHTLRHASESTRFWVGRVLPLVPTYGFIALSFYERLYSQEHWLSDQVIGATLGIAAGNFFYLIHFDDTGAPLRDNRGHDGPTSFLSDNKLTPIVLPGGAMGAAWSFTW